MISLKSAFDEHDKNKTGLSTQQLLETLNSVGMKLEEDQKDELFASIDKNQSGKIEYIELVQFIENFFKRVYSSRKD